MWFCILNNKPATLRNALGTALELPTTTKQTKKSGLFGRLSWKRDTLCTVKDDWPGDQGADQRCSTAVGWCSPTSHKRTKQTMLVTPAREGEEPVCNLGLLWVQGEGPPEERGSQAEESRFPSWFKTGSIYVVSDNLTVATEGPGKSPWMWATTFPSIFRPDVLGRVSQELTESVDSYL